MLKTYTLYLRDGGADDRFEPAMCETDVEALARARELLVHHPECETVEVYFDQDCLFVVRRPSP
jgi:hypothetical protein